MDEKLDIDATTWRRVSPLLDTALDLPPQMRAGWLAALPAQHADLGRGDPGAIQGRHGVRHVGDEGIELRCIKLNHRFGHAV